MGHQLKRNRRKGVEEQKKRKHEQQEESRGRKDDRHIYPDHRVVDNPPRRNEGRKEKKMTAQEKKAREMIARQSTENLLDQWELTEAMEGPEVPMMRGWYMDELEKRNPEAFDKWLEEDAEDASLRKYMMEVA